MEQPSSVLIVLLGAIGDVVRGLAVATHLKKQWPNTRVTWAVEPISRSLVEHHPSIDRVVVFDRKRKLAGYKDFIAELRGEHYDVCLDLQRHFKSGLTAKLSGAKRRIGFDFRNSREANWLFQTELIKQQIRLTPKIQQFFAFIDALGLPPVDKADFALRPTAAEQQRVDELLQIGTSASGPLCALLIGSTWPSRIWSAENYILLSRMLWEKYKMRVVCVGGPSDLAMAEKIAAELGECCINIAGKTSLRELSAVFLRVRTAVGSDSGPMHIAAACNLTVVSLWGATSPIRSGPYGSEGYVLQSAIGCSPCYRRECPGLGQACMAALTPQIVFSQLERLFDEQGGLQ